MRAPGQPDNEEARLEKLASYGVLDTEREQAFDDLVELASHIMGVPIALVSLVDANRQWFKARVGLDATETPREVSFCGHAVCAGQMLVVPDAHLDERFADNPLVTGAPGVRFYAGAPLTTADGFTLGTLCAIDHVPGAASETQLRMLAALSRQAVSQLELRRTVRELREHRDESQAFFELSVDLHCVAGFDRYFKQLNPAWERTLGWRREELRKSPMFGFVHKADWPALEAGLAALEGGAPSATFETRFLCRDGTFRALSWRAAADLSAGRVYAVARDQTAERDVETLKSDFVSVVSHELRTPLTSIRGALRMVDGGIAGEIPAKAGSLIGIATQNTERLVRLVNDILDLEKIQSGRLDLAPREHALPALLQEVVRSLHGVAEPAGVSLRIEPEVPETVFADRDALLMVLTNLLSNAIKHSEPDGVVTVRARERERPGTLRVEVEDAGPGIALADQEKVFLRFRQLDSSAARSRGGSGLGLAICKAIVEEHGGTIGVDSELGKGSRFYFDLPTSTS